MKPDMISKEVLIEYEKNEIEYWKFLYQLRKGSHLVPEARKFGPFMSFKIPEVDILAFNRVLTGGADLNDFDSYLHELINFYRVSSIPRFFIQLNSTENTTEIHRILSGRGFTHYNDWTRFSRSADFPVPDLTNDPEVVRINKEQASLYADTILKSFDFPVHLKCHFTSLTGAPGYRLYLANQGRRTIGAGALFTRGRYASMAMAGTLPDHRGKGAQRVLLRKRLLDARIMGCDLVTVETTRETTDKKVASYRNMVRFGFQIVYHRPNFIYYLL